MKPYVHDRHVLSTRDDPHAQARHARSQPLLLHSLTLFRDVFATLFDQRTITTVVEIGVESGQVSGMYAGLGAEAVYCVEPEPTAELRAALENSAALHLVAESSPEVLDTLPIADLYVIDGDHNYAVVRQELDWILRHAPDAVIALHDVSWPCARRDQYYQSSALPGGRPAHPDSEDGPTVWHDQLTPAGFVGHGAFTAATEAGGERNGVLTAVEDALASTPDDPWELAVIPAVFGMGIVVRRASANAAAVIEAVRPLSTSSLVAALENNRIALYTGILQLQHEAAAHADDADQLATTIARQQEELDALRDELSDTRMAHQARVDHLIQQKHQLATELEETRASCHEPTIGGVISRVTNRVRSLRNRVAKP